MNILIMMTFRGKNNKSNLKENFFFFKLVISIALRPHLEEWKTIASS